MKNCYQKMLLGLSATLFATTAALAAEPKIKRGDTDDFNVCILESVDLVHQSREGLGYADGYFTRDLDYGPAAAVVKASAKRGKSSIPKDLQF
jgi:hypothetical protein